MIKKNRTTIPLAELKFEFSRSSGSGGQNINKVNTKVVLRWNFLASEIINDQQKWLINNKLKNRLNDRGELVIHCQKTRLQSQNKIQAIELLNDNVNKALIIQPKRVPTRTPRRTKESRLKTKKINSEKKKLRKNIF